MQTSRSRPHRLHRQRHRQRRRQPRRHPSPQSVAPNSRYSDVPITWPTTVAGWLIGAGSLLGAIFLIANLGNVVSLLLFVALLGVAASVFVADHMPDIPQLSLLVLVTTMIGLGVALARAGFTRGRRGHALPAGHAGRRRRRPADRVRSRPAVAAARAQRRVSAAA